MYKNKTGCQVGGACPQFLEITWYVYVLWVPVFLVLFLLVDNCSGGGTGAQPTSFLYSDQQDLELISWQQDSSSGSTHRVRAAQLQLAATVQSPPVDSDADSYDRSVQTARQYVANIEVQESKIAESSDPCSATGIFDELYPPDPSLFWLTPYATADDASAHTTYWLVAPDSPCRCRRA